MPVASDEVKRICGEMTLSAKSRAGILPLTIIADDLTGAMDTGLQFARAGFRTVVFHDLNAVEHKAHVVSYDTESRNIKASEAYWRVSVLAARLGSRAIYKKIDSTLRGNIGFELRALLKALRPEGILVMPAFPDLGRITHRGVHYVYGKPLEATSFARDPRWPMTESRVATLLMRQAGVEVAEVPLDVVRRGPRAFISALDSARARLIVADAITRQDLAIAAHALAMLGPSWIPCGSAGLAGALAELVPSIEPPKRNTPQVSRALIVVASRHPLTVRQLRVVCDRLRVSPIELDAEACYVPERESARLVDLAGRALVHRDVILSACTSRMLPGASMRILDVLAMATRELVRMQSVGGLVLTGGDTAIRILRSLGSRGLEITHELQPGIPGGRALLGEGARELWVVTKAGGFGNENALHDAILWLHGADRSLAVQGGQSGEQD